MNQNFCMETRQHIRKLHNKTGMNLKICYPSCYGTEKVTRRKMLYKFQIVDRFLIKEKNP